MSFLIAELSIVDGNEITFVDAPVFQAFVPLVYLEEDNVIHVQWTIFRELNWFYILGIYLLKIT